uniref:Uncharacterized protein n=1 Tax=Candidatus Kentrum sp. FM TaxID=2126340 RepID=A0A450TVH0_9GAMM|nr:MAG: hypothetical protein BECKFM1743C_GA0114222_106922 [Candidatus Kentron sp. FM]VFK20818.1 MAG: hypothetical protein BECKFM1743B_GA0114221_107322 [Candidatus Kentron sp. FM]
MCGSVESRPPDGQKFLGVLWKISWVRDLDKRLTSCSKTAISSQGQADAWGFLARIGQFPAMARSGRVTDAGEQDRQTTPVLSSPARRATMRGVWKKGARSRKNRKSVGVVRSGVSFRVGKFIPAPGVHLGARSYKKARGKPMRAVSWRVPADSRP